MPPFHLIHAPTFASQGKDGPIRFAEEIACAIYQHSAIGMVVCDISGRFLSVNAAMSRFLGYDETELLTRTFMDITHPDEIAPYINQCTALLNGDGHAFQSEQRYIHKSGRALWALTVVFAIRDVQGLPQYTIGQILDISQLKATEQTVREYHEQIQRLVAHNNLLIEAERKRIAQEVHDEIGQLLTVLKIDMQLYRSITPGESPLQQHTEDMLGLIDRTIAAVRDVTYHLRPPALNVGLVAALEWLTRDMARRTSLQFSLDCDSHSVVIDDQVATAAFRIAQESITNIIRHARATQVVIALHYRQAKLHLKITDNGCGFDIEKGFQQNGFGLLGMRERVAALGGEFSIESKGKIGAAAGVVVGITKRAASGTTVRIALPVKLPC